MQHNTAADTDQAMTLLSRMMNQARSDGYASLFRLFALNKKYQISNKVEADTQQGFWVGKSALNFSKKIEKFRDENFSFCGKNVKLIKSAKVVVKLQQENCEKHYCKLLVWKGEFWKCMVVKKWEEFEFKVQKQICQKFVQKLAKSLTKNLSNFIQKFV